MLAAFGLDLATVENKFSALDHNVKLVFFTRESDCPSCNEARQLFERLASITHKIEFQYFNFAINKEKDREYGVFTVPALAIIGAKDYGIRYYGYPRGNEVNDFLDDIILVSQGKDLLQPENVELLRQLYNPVRLKIFMSPTCPYSLPVAKMAIKLAIASEYIKTDIIHAVEFMDLSEKYKVRGIPMTVVNEQDSFYGALDERDYIARVIELATM